MTDLEPKRGTPGLNAALAKARLEFADIPRTRRATVKMKTGGSYSYSYADLADVFRAVTPGLSANELAITQYPDGTYIVTAILHSSGEERVSNWPVKPMPARGIDDAQSYQSAVQVAKRYALTAALGISTEETVEGDPRAHRREPAAQDDPGTVNPEFETPDGVRHPVGAKFTPKMTPREKAVEAQRAIVAQLDEAKTEKGLSGAWGRNEMFIEALRDRHADLFDNLYAHYSAREDAMTAPDENAD